MKLHCDRCERECPPLNEASELGWFLSSKLSISGIPWELLCPDCFYNYNPFKKRNK